MLMYSSGAVIATQKTDRGERERKRHRRGLTVVKGSNCQHSDPLLTFPDSYFPLQLSVFSESAFFCLCLSSLLVLLNLKKTSSVGY